MKDVSHEDQQRLWNDEHKKPTVLKQMDSDVASSGVIKFYEWLKQNRDIRGLKGLEMGCGKGRNVIWLAKQGFAMTGFDFSATAIEEAKKRAKETNTVNASFLMHDATQKWKFLNKSFDFAIDCFASTDIENPQGRAFANSEFSRVLKPNGYLLVYALSTDDQFHKKMIGESPASEKNAFLHPTTGKFEKVFDREELIDLHKDLKLVKEERVAKTAIFFGKEYGCRHFWMVFQKTS